MSIRVQRYQDEYVIRLSPEDFDSMIVEMGKAVRYAPQKFRSQMVWWPLLALMVLKTTPEEELTERDDTLIREFEDHLDAEIQDMS